MDFAFSEAEREVAALARTILEDHTTNERLRAHEASGATHDAALWRALAGADLLGVAIPEADGGSGLGFVALGLLLQEVGRTVAPVPVYETLALGALPIAEFGDAAARADLAAVASGELVLTAALTEATSSDPLRVDTRVDGDGRLTGTKTQVPAGAIAHRILVPARADDGTIGIFWLEPSTTGVTVESQRTIGGPAYAQVTLAGATPTGRLDRDGNGAAILHWIVERARAARYMMQLGVTERALEYTAAYGRERVQFDRPIGSFQAFHQRAADAYIHVESIRLTAWEALWRLGAGLDATTEVLVAKYCAAEGGQYVAFACTHLHGGVGIDVDHPLHRYFKWATQIEHELGSARHQLDLLGTELAAR